MNPADFPEEGTLAEQARFLTTYALLAPSEGSSQPCVFEYDDETLHLSVSNSHQLSDPSADQRQQYFNLGCALENFTVAAKQFDVAHRVSYRPDGSSAYVSIDLNPKWTFPSEPSPEQFKQLTKGQICADQLEDRSLSHELIQQIRKMPSEDVVSLQLVTDTGLISKFMELQEQLTKKDEKRSNAQKQSDEKNKQEKKEIGFWNRVLAFLRSLFSSGDASVKEEEEKKKDQKDIEAYDTPSYLPPAVVLCGWTNGPVTWIKCGRVFQRMSLMTGGSGVVIQPFQKVMAHSRARDTVQNLIDTPGNTVAQFLFRLGYGNAEEKTPRITVEEVFEE